MKELWKRLTGAYEDANPNEVLAMAELCVVAREEWNPDPEVPFARIDIEATREQVELWEVTPYELLKALINEECERLCSEGVLCWVTSANANFLPPHAISEITVKVL
jgi:hypothetical protein